MACFARAIARAPSSSRWVNFTDPPSAGNSAIVTAGVKPSEPGDALVAVTLGLLVEGLVLQEVEDRDAEPTPGLGGPVEVEELGDDVRPGQDDRLPAIDLGDLRRQRVDRRVADDLAARDGAAGAERLEALGELGVRAVLAVLADRLEVHLAHRH